MRSFHVTASTGAYPVTIGSIEPEEFHSLFDLEHAVYVIDRALPELHSFLQVGLADQTVIAVDASERTKELGQVRLIAEEIINSGLTRSHTIVAVGGGIVQDIVAFCASIIYRGVNWAFVPTTLLAQADSCIGSKSSINLMDRKNALGTFLAPRFVRIDPTFLDTLAQVDIRSGLGEMLKVHAIAGPKYFDSFAEGFDGLLCSPEGLGGAIHDSLLHKRKLIELDEFDSGARLVMNYGHTFGHAIELATNYRIPHGIAITIGCDVANYVAVQLGLSTQVQFDRMHQTLLRNYREYSFEAIDMSAFSIALQADKKHSPDHFIFILPDKEGAIGVQEIPRAVPVSTIAIDYLQEIGT